MENSETKWVGRHSTETEREGKKKKKDSEQNQSYLTTTYLSSFYSCCLSFVKTVICPQITADIIHSGGIVKLVNITST